MTDNTRLPGDYNIFEGTAPYAWVKCGTDAALAMLRLAGFDGWVAGGATAPAESGKLYEAARASETASWRSKNPVGDTQAGLIGGIHRLYGVSVSTFRPSDLAAFLRQHPGWSFVIPISAYYLKGSIYDLDHFSVAHRTPGGSGHDVAVDVRPGGLYLIEPLHSGPATFITFDGPELASLVSAYNNWGRDTLLGLQLNSLAPVPVIYAPREANDMPVFIDPARIADSRKAQGFTGRLRAGAWVTLKVAGATGIAQSGNITLPDNVVGVVVNVTATKSLGAGYVTVRGVIGNPKANPTSAVNFKYGEDKANECTVGLGLDGTLAFHSTVDVDIVVDVTAYFLPA